LYKNPYYIPPDEFFARIKGEINWKTYKKAINSIICNKKIEETAKRREKEKKLILDSITESVVYYGRNKRIQWVNKTAAEAVNMQPEDLIGALCYEIWHHRESPCTFCPLTKTWESKTYQEGEITTPDGRTWLARANPVYENGEMVGVVAVGRDITERKQAEEALKRSEENFRVFFENEPEYCYMISPEGVILDINKSALKMLGYKKEEIVGKPLFTTVYAPSSREKARHLFMKWKKEGALRNEELMIVTKDGRERVVLLSAAAMRDSKGDIIHSISVQRDITEKKNVEEQINQSLKEKEVLIKEIHHRVKNNMQVILSLLNLQSASIENAELLTRFQESQRRIKSMAVIHEKLYQSEDFAHIDFSDCIRILAEEAVRLYKTDVALTIDADTVFLGIDTAIPCGLIVNELVSNAAKHAFPEERFL
jgi:PAS domain S-box-containing protein